MLKMRFAAEKSRFGAVFTARRHESEPGVGRGSPSWGRVKIDYSLLESVLDRVGQALGWSAPVGALFLNTPAWASLRERKLPRRILEAYAIPPTHTGAQSVDG